MKKALTLIELIVVIIITGILATLALPRFGKTLETNRAKEAKAALEQIRTAERIYRTEEEYYYPHNLKPLTGTPIERIKKINENLKLYLETKANRNWDFTVEDTVADGDEFTAKATRTSGGATYQGGKIKIDQDGNLTKDGWPLPLPEQ